MMQPARLRVRVPVREQHQEDRQTTVAKSNNTTTRSYTLGLLSTSDTEDWLPLWKRLFKMHDAVCRGAREYGELYLNLRGGLGSSLAENAKEKDAERRRLLQRGARRMLALGWFSVESVRGAEHHPFRVRERVCTVCKGLPKPGCQRDHQDEVSELKPGQSLPAELADRLLREVLTDHKGVTKEGLLDEWTQDCVLAITAQIRPDAVIVNRAAAFADWQRSVVDHGAEMPEQACRILFAMCGDGFVSLTLPEEDAVRQDDDPEESESTVSDDAEGKDTSKPKGDVDDVEPSNASRGVFGDLFGGDAAEKVSRATRKQEFAIKVREMLEGLHAPPTQEAVDEFRKRLGLPELDTSKPDKYPKEVSSSGHPTAFAIRYRKLLVSLNLWPKSEEESGQPRAPAVSKFGRRVEAKDEQSRNAHINAMDLIDACPKPNELDNGLNDASTPARVFTPAWAPALADRVAAITNMPVNAKPLNEFKRLMFALAARRISQTQTWTKRNEAERHKAAVKEDAARKKLEELDPDSLARDWLTAYEAKRGDDSLATMDFRITRRMIGECDAVFKAWRGVESSEEREKRTASVQAKTEKFGDARLYTDLSEDSAGAAIWRHEQGAEIVKQWVKLRQAQFDQQRLKIPRFCHPDTFHHPTWCEFGGVSKPKVWYAWKPDNKPQSPEPGGDADGSRRLWMLLPDFGSEQAKAVPLRWRSKRLSKDLGGVKEYTEESIPRADRLSLAAANLPRKDAENKPIRYRPAHPFVKSKKGWNARLQIDRDTLERLERYWDCERREWRDGGKHLRQCRWFITFAPALAVSVGPGCRLHSKLGWRSGPHAELNKKQKREGHAKLILSRLAGLRVLSVDLGHRYAASCVVWHTLAKADFQKEVHGRTTLAGGTREDSLYLLTRHQDPATGKDRTTIYRRLGQDTLPGNVAHPAPWARLDRQFLIKLQGEEKPARAASNGAMKDRSASDTNEAEIVANLAKCLGLSRDESHVRSGRGVDELMGRAVRIATLGLQRHGRRAKIAYAFRPDCPGIPGVGGALNAAAVSERGEAYVRFLTGALADWHALATDTEWDGSHARDLWNRHIATLPRGFQIDSPSPNPDDAPPSRQQRRKINDTLRDEKIQPIARHLASLPASATEEMHKEWAARWSADDGTERTKDDFAHTPVVNAAGKVTGSSTSPKSGTQPATGWHSHLRILTDWLMGRRLPGQRSTRWNRYVGGLSLTRIATMRSLYQLHKAFAMRPTPDKVQGAPKFGESNTGIAQSILDAMETMREQRVKQLASRIAAGALGLGGHWKQVRVPLRDKDGKPRRGEDGQALFKTKAVWQEDQEAKHPTCHAVVIENLRNYRPDELQTRRENKALMSWSSGKVRKYLEEACQLHGLHLREVQPNYTSRQCSRTGVPGIRCTEVPVSPETGKVTAYWWNKTLAAAKKKVDEGSEDSEAHLIVDLDRNLLALKTKGETLPKSVIVPRKGGDLFHAAPASPPSVAERRAVRTIQADLNAAANIGLRAILDPDFAGKWWYIPAVVVNGRRVPASKSCAGAACLNGWSVAPDRGSFTNTGQALIASNNEDLANAEADVAAAKQAWDREKKTLKKTGGDTKSHPFKLKLDAAKQTLAEIKKSTQQKEIINLWQDPRADRSKPDDGRWMESGAYWGWVRRRAIDSLRLAYGLTPKLDQIVEG